MKYLDDLIDRWHAEGLHFLPAASEVEVRNVFRAIGAEATADVITLFTSIGGMGEMDKEFWRLWTLDEIKSENTEHSPNGVLFSDYLVASWCFRLKANSDGTSAVLVDYFDGSDPVVVANTLSEFFRLYSTDATRLVDPASLD
jgi:hypothetical protein